jgi:hypothetical protein
MIKAESFRTFVLYVAGRIDAFAMYSAKMEEGESDEGNL